MIEFVQVLNIAYQALLSPQTAEVSADSVGAGFLSSRFPSAGEIGFCERLARHCCALWPVRWCVCLCYTPFALVRNLFGHFGQQGLSDGPLVSIVIPVGRKDWTYERMRRSIEVQRYRNLEVIAVDDEGHRGAGWARNVGLERAGGKYVMFLDADDFFEPTLVSRLVALAESESLDITMCAADRYEQNWRLFSPMSWRFRRKFVPEKPVFSASDCQGGLFQAVTMNLWTKMFRRDFILRAGVRFQEIPRSNDIFFVCALASEAERMAIDPRVLSHYRHGQTCNLQSGNNESPTSCFEALDALRSHLISTGKWAAVQGSFARLYESVVRHNVVTTTGAARLAVIRRVRRPRVQFLGDGLRVGGGTTYIRQKMEEWGCETDSRAPDIIHVEHVRPLLRLLWNPLARPSAPVSFVVHGVHLRKYDFLPRTHLNRLRRWFRLCLERYLYSRVDELIALNQDDVAFLRRVHGVRGRIRVETNHVAPVSEPARSPEFAFVMVARFDFQKGQDVLLEAIAQVQDALRAAGKRTLFIGGGRTLMEMKTLASLRGIADLVEFAGEIPNAADEMWRGRTLVAPSRWEGSSFSILEAIARGKRILASACPGSRDLVKEGSVGRLFPVGDSKALADLLVAE